MNAFNKDRAGAKSNLVDNCVTGQGERDPSVIGDAAVVCLVARDVAAVTIRGAVSGQEMTASWDHRAGTDGQASGHAGGIVRPADFPAANVHLGVTVVIQFNELVIGAAGPTCPELANDHGRLGSGRRRRRRRRARAGRR